MSRLAISGAILALVAALAVVGPSLTGAQEGTPPFAASGFVGSWRVAVTEPTGRTFPVLSTYGADGTTLHSGPVSQPAAPGAPNAIVFNATGHGVWEPTGAEASAVTFNVLNSDENGNFLGTLTVSGTQRIGAGGDTFTGEYVITVRDPAGGVVAAFPTTAEAERIGIEPAAVSGTPEAATPAD